MQPVTRTRNWNPWFQIEVKLSLTMQPHVRLTISELQYWPGELKAVTQRWAGLDKKQFTGEHSFIYEMFWISPPPPLKHCSLRGTLKQISCITWKTIGIRKKIRKDSRSCQWKRCKNTNQALSSKEILCRHPEKGRAGHTSKAEK